MVKVSVNVNVRNVPRALWTRVTVCAAVLHMSRRVAVIQALTEWGDSREKETPCGD